MTAVAKRAVSRTLTAAPGDTFAFRYFDLDRRKLRPFVGAVAVRLFFRLSARAPETRAGLLFVDIGAPLRNDWIWHIGSFPSH